jgi:membrane protein implicated in regulation of membrane protease activity
MKKPPLTHAELILALVLALLVGVAIDIWKIWETGSFRFYQTISYSFTSLVLYLLLRPLTQRKKMP